MKSIVLFFIGSVISIERGLAKNVDTYRLFNWYYSF